MLTHYSASSLKEKKESTNNFNTVEVNQFYSYIVVEVILLLIKGMNQATFRSLSNIVYTLLLSNSNGDNSWKVLCHVSNNSFKISMKKCYYFITDFISLNFSPTVALTPKRQVKRQN